MNNIEQIKKKLGKRANLNEPLSKYTFLKIGGPADIYFEADNTDELIKVIRFSRTLNVPITMLGDGSNVLVSDGGIRGLVLVNKSSSIEILKETSMGESQKRPPARWESDSELGSFKYEFKDLDYSELDAPRILVRLDSGVKLPFAIDYLLDRGITGLQWFAGIPGTIGGAVFNNIHGGTHFISEVIDEVKIITKSGKMKTLQLEDLGVDYDKSRFQESGEIIVNATLKLYLGNVGKAKFVRKEWAKRKSLQPRNTPGCAFHNLTQSQRKKLSIPTTSMGFVIEHLLKMSGFKIGNAQISEKHHNFIVNRGKATAEDYLAVMKEIYKKAKKQLGITLVPEIFLLGFDDDEIREFRQKRQIKLRKTRSKEIRTIYKDSKKLFK